MQPSIAANRILVFMFTLLFAGHCPAWGEDNIPGVRSQKIAATVNGSPIYEKMLNAEMERIASKGWTTGMAGNSAEALKSRRSKALDTLITSELLRQASRTVVAGNLESRISERWQEMKKKYPTDREFTEELKKRGKKPVDIRDEIRDEVLLAEYLNGIKSSATPVNDTETEAFYNSNRRSFMVPEQIKVRHILVSTGGTSAESHEKAFKKAGGLREQVIAGKSFAEVAQTSSACASAAKGGELEYFSRGYMPAEFEKVAFALKPGEISAPVKTRHGFHIIELLDRKPETTRPFTEVREFIASFLKQQKGNERMKRHLTELKQKAIIGITAD